MSFIELGLSEKFCERLRAKNILEPTPIQAEVFTPIVSGQSVLGLSKTGTGKTFAYLCPLVDRLSQSTQGTEGIRGLVLVPTRELATQVSRDLETLCGAEQRGTVIVGGEAEEKQIKDSLSTTWIIATPGRLLDLLKRRMLDVSHVQALVFDEADRLLDMGFIDEIRAIMKFLPRPMQLLFFSATLHFGVDEMAYEFGAECFRFGQEEDQVTVEGLDHKISFVGDDEKFHALVWYLTQQEGKRGIIFSNYREKVHEVSSRLRGLGMKAGGLTAQLTQSARSKIMDEFRSGKMQVLLASDLASRGLDVFDIDYVVNFDLPEDPAVYVHRVGRTARAGRKGNALSFVGYEDSYRLGRLENFLGKPIERFQFPVDAFSGRLHRFGPSVKENNEGYSAQASSPQSERPQRTQASPRTQRQHDNAQVAQKPEHKAPRPQAKPAATKTTQLSFWKRLMQRVAKVFGAKSAKPTVATKPAATKSVSVAAGGSATTGRQGAFRGGRGRGGSGSSRGGRSSSGRPPRSRGPGRS